MILSALIFMPFFAGLLLLFIPKTVGLWLTKFVCLATSLLFLALSLYIYANFDASLGTQYEVKINWIYNYGIFYHIGLDAIALSILMCIAILMPAVFLVMWEEDKKGFFANLLILQGSVTGALLSLDLILFYLFWEVMLLPIFFMIGLYSKEHDKNVVAIKVTLYTMLGSLFMLGSIIYLGVQYFNQTGSWSFELDAIKDVHLAEDVTFLAFLGFVLAFAIKIPIFPLHTWLGDTYSRAPIGAVVILSSIMAKLGVYAIIRFLFPIFEDFIALYDDYFIIFGLIGMFYFGVLSLMQDDIRKMYAYSSGSHLSIIVIGIFLLNDYGFLGAMYLVIAHALSTGGLFLLVYILEQNTKTRSIKAMGGIAKKAPVFAVFFAFMSFSIVSIPGTSGFVSELLIIIGAFERNIILGSITALTVLIAMTFMFWTLQRVILQNLKPATEDFQDMNLRSILALLPIVLLIVYMGIFPKPFLDQLASSSEIYTNMIDKVLP